MYTNKRKNSIAHHYHVIWCCKLLPLEITFVINFIQVFSTYVNLNIIFTLFDCLHHRIRGPFCTLDCLVICCFRDVLWMEDTLCAECFSCLRDLLQINLLFRSVNFCTVSIIHDKKNTWVQKVYHHITVLFVRYLLHFEI